MDFGFVEGSLEVDIVCPEKEDGPPDLAVATQMAESCGEGG